MKFFKGGERVKAEMFNTCQTRLQQHSDVHIHRPHTSFPAGHRSVNLHGNTGARCCIPFCVREVMYPPWAPKNLLYCIRKFAILHPKICYIACICAITTVVVVVYQASYQQP
jgi:hypothetical protein